MEAKPDTEPSNFDLCFAAVMSLLCFIAFAKITYFLIGK